MGFNNGDSGDPHKWGEELHCVAVAPRLKHWSMSIGQSYLDEQRQIVMESEPLSETQYSLCQDNATVSRKTGLANEV